MAEQTSIVTQAELGEINFQLQELANNLGAHSNGSLAEAHGINTFPGVNPDDYGNDLTNYCDSGGNIIGDKHIRFVVGGLSYWVPGQSSGLAGQPTNLNVTTLNSDGLALEGIGGSAWATVFSADVLSSLTTVNDSYLLPHTRLGHWETHGSISAVSKTTYNSGGFKLGTHVIKLAYGGVVYELPAADRFGGPIQPVVATSSLTGYEECGGTDIRDGHRANPSMLSVTVQSGTRPISVAWYCNRPGYSPYQLVVIPPDQQTIGADTNLFVDHIFTDTVAGKDRYNISVTMAHAGLFGIKAILSNGATPPAEIEQIYYIFDR